MYYGFLFPLHCTHGLLSDTSRADAEEVAVVDGGGGNFLEAEEVATDEAVGGGAEARAKLKR